MRPNELRELLRQQPFVPLRLHVTGGMVFEVRHPEMAHVTRSTVRIELPQLGGVDRVATIALLHVNRVEALSPAG
jgi:hypothetical protein